MNCIATDRGANRYSFSSFSWRALLLRCCCAASALKRRVDTRKSLAFSKREGGGIGCWSLFVNWHPCSEYLHS